MHSWGLWFKNVLQPWWMFIKEKYSLRCIFEVCNSEMFSNHGEAFRWNGQKKSFILVHSCVIQEFPPTKAKVSYGIYQKVCYSAAFSRSMIQKFFSVIVQVLCKIDRIDCIQTGGCCSKMIEIMKQRDLWEDREHGRRSSMILRYLQSC